MAGGGGQLLEHPAGGDGGGQRLQDVIRLFGAGRLPVQLGQAGGQRVELAQLLGPRLDRLHRGVELLAGGPALDHQRVVLLAAQVEGLEGGGGRLGGPAGGDNGVGLLGRHHLGGRGPGRAVRRFCLQHLQIGQHAPQPVVLGRPVAGVLAGRVPGRVQRGDPEQLQHQSSAIGGGVVGERGQLLLLGEHRRPEGGVVHAEHRLDEPLRVPGPGRHQGPVAVRFHRDLRVDAAQRATHQVQVALVLELHLGDAVATYAGRADLLLGGAGLPPEGEQNGLEQGRLAGPVGPVDAHQPGGQLEVQLVLVDPEVAQVEPLDQHAGPAAGVSAPMMARSRYSCPSNLTRSRSRPVRSWSTT